MARAASTLTKLPGLAVGKGDPPFAVDRKKGVADAFQHDLQLLLRFVQRCARGMLLGHVARRRIRHLAQCAPAHRGRHDDRAAILAHPAVLDVAPDRDARAQLGTQGLEPGALLFVQQFVVAAPHQLLRPVAEDVEGGRVQAQEAAVGIDQGDQVQRIFDQGGVFLGQPRQVRRRCQCRSIQFPCAAVICLYLCANRCAGCGEPLRLAHLPMETKWHTGNRAKYKLSL